MHDVGRFKIYTVVKQLLFPHKISRCKNTQSEKTKQQNISIGDVIQ